MTCDDFEVAIERRHHHALPPEEAAHLAKHLPTCDHCRRFAGTVETIDASLQRMHDKGGADLATVRGTIDRETQRRTWRIAGTMAVQAMWLGGFAWWLSQVDATARHQWIPAMVSLLVLGATSWRAVTRAANEAEAVVRGEGDLFVFWRRRVDGEIERARTQRWLPLMALVLCGVLWTLHTPGSETVFLVGAAGLLATSLVVATRASLRLARLRRERASLA